jgi:hypothetical protein
MHLVMATALAALCSHAAYADPEADSSSSGLKRDYPSVYGTPAQPALADRIVRLGPSEQSVKVDQGDTVEFIALSDSGAEQSFAWRFDGSPSKSSLDLSEVAPAGFPGQKLRIYVIPDELHRGAGR